MFFSGVCCLGGGYCDVGYECIIINICWCVGSGGGGSSGGGFSGGSIIICGVGCKRCDIGYCIFEDGMCCNRGIGCYCEVCMFFFNFYLVFSWLNV